MKRQPFLTNIFMTVLMKKHMALVNKGINPLMFPGLKTSITSDDSKAINFD